MKLSVKNFFKNHMSHASLHFQPKKKIMQSSISRFTALRLIMIIIIAFIVFVRGTIELMMSYHHRSMMSLVESGALAARDTRSRREKELHIEMIMKNETKRAH